MKVRITKKVCVATDVCSFELVDIDGGGLPRFSAGAHIDVHVGETYIRQYSLCNDPEEAHRYAIAVLREPASRGGSVAMHQLEEGAVIEISEPRNHFPLVGGAGHSILLAGGIGITPVLCMVEHLAKTGASYELHYCTRSPERTAFRARLAHPDIRDQASIYFDTMPQHERADLSSILASPSPQAHVYVCGPAGFIDAVLGAARQNGWADANLHREYFAAQPSESGDNSPFQIKLACSGRIIDVTSQQTAVEALQACGVDIPTSCEQGVCGTCVTRVLSGEPDHRDSYLTDEERAANDQFLPCCSRSKTAMLTLDL
jgi:vanillate O-demethylase ferredoxin subunit